MFELRNPTLRIGGCDRLLAARSPPPQITARHHKSHADNLHQRNSSMQKQRAIRISAHNLDQPALNAIQNQIRAGNLARKSLPPAQPNQNNKISNLRSGLVKLRRMQSHTNRRAHKLLGNRTRKFPAPRQRSRPPTTTSRQEASGASDGV